MVVVLFYTTERIMKKENITNLQFIKDLINLKFPRKIHCHTKRVLLRCSDMYYAIQCRFSQRIALKLIININYLANNNKIRKFNVYL